MGQPSSGTIRFLGALAGLIVGAGLGALVGMGFNNIVIAAVIGGSIGLRLLFPERGRLYIGRISQSVLSTCFEISMLPNPALEPIITLPRDDSISPNRSAASH
jgi:hypothetical protein